MKVIWHDDFCQVYTSDPAAAAGRMEPIIAAVKEEGFPVIEAYPAGLDDILRVHTRRHVQTVERQGLYNIAALAAGGAMMAADIGMKEPTFAAIRPPGHHASEDSSWGFCFFNNIAVALESLRAEGRIKKAYILDFDLHFGDGTVNILEPKGYVTIFNPDAVDRKEYIKSVEKSMRDISVDIIAISAGFDNHVHDWGGVLETEDYYTIGHMVFEKCKELNCGCFAVLEGGYNFDVLPNNVVAFIKGLSGM